MTETKLTVVGFAVCPVGTLRGDSDGDSMRSNLLSDGRVFNIFTGYSYPLPDTSKAPLFKQPQPVRNLVAALISSDKLASQPLKLTHVGNQLDGRDASDYGPAAVAQGVDASVLDNTRIVFENGGLCIMYGSDVEKSFADGTPGGDERELLQAAREAKCPEVLITAGEKLIAAGFRSAALNSGALNHLVFLKGDKYNPIRAEVSWIV